MSQAPELDETRITTDALRQFVDWNGVFRRAVQSHACRIAAEVEGECLVTPAILEEAIIATCTQMIERIRSEPGGEQENDTRAA